MPNNWVARNNWIGQEQGFNWGFHGELRTHLYAYADGHADFVEFSVRSNVKSVQADSVVRSSSYQLRGSNTEYQPVNGTNSSCSGGLASTFVFGPSSNPDIVSHLMWSGPGWQMHTFPSPAYDTGICWN